MAARNQDPKPIRIEYTETSIELIPPMETALSKALRRFVEQHFESMDAIKPLWMFPAHQPTTLKPPPNYRGMFSILDGPVA